MEIINEKGELLGLINIIDALVILVVLSLLAGGSALVLGSQDTQDTQDTQDAEIVTVTLKVERVEPYIAKAVNTGNISEDVTLTQKSMSPAKTVISDSEGQLHVREHPVNKAVELQAELRVQEKSGVIQFRGQPLRLGREITLSSEKVSFTGTVTDIQE